MYIEKFKQSLDFYDFSILYNFSEDKSDFPFTRCAGVLSPGLRRKIKEVATGAS